MHTSFQHGRDQLGVMHLPTADRMRGQESNEPV
jgi:hypothetical protein